MRYSVHVDSEPMNSSVYHLEYSPRRSFTTTSWFEVLLFFVFFGEYKRVHTTLSLMFILSFACCVQLLQVKLVECAVPDAIVADNESTEVDCRL